MKSRRRAREFVLQALYAYEVGDTPILHTLATFSEEENAGDARLFARELAGRTVDNLSPIDSVIREQVENWDLDRVAVIDKNILRMAVSEMLYFPDVPLKVSIDEAIELAKKFSTEKSGKFVNGILDPISKKQSGNKPAVPEESASDNLKARKKRDERRKNTEIEN